MEKWKIWLSVFVAVGAILALIFACWRLVILPAQAEKRELSLYRERLFSEDTTDRIFAATSLSNYPKQAMWLVKGWAREHKLIAENKKSGVEISNHEEVKRAIADALGIMASQTSWDWRYYWKVQIPEFIREVRGMMARQDSRSWHDVAKSGLALVRKLFRLSPWIKNVKGPRLDRLQITNDIGPIPLRHAHLYKSNLTKVNLWGADLREANFQEADLREANLEEADLGEANLRGADLRKANLRGAYLRVANLQEAKLVEANLEEADLGEANLRGANPGKANLRGGAPHELWTPG